MTGDEEFELLSRAASKSGQPVEVWARATLVKAARRATLAPRTKTSKYRGVSRHAIQWQRADGSVNDCVRWQAAAGKQYIGSFVSEEEAARAYDEVARQTGRPLNFPDAA